MLCCLQQEGEGIHVELPVEILEEPNRTFHRSAGSIDVGVTFLLYGGWFLGEGYTWLGSTIATASMCFGPVGMFLTVGAAGRKAE